MSRVRLKDRLKVIFSNKNLKASKIKQTVPLIQRSNSHQQLSQQYQQPPSQQQYHQQQHSITTSNTQQPAYNMLLPITINVPTAIPQPTPYYVPSATPMYPMANQYQIPSVNSSGYLQQYTQPGQWSQYQTYSQCPQYSQSSSSQQLSAPTPQFNTSTNSQHLNQNYLQSQYNPFIQYKEPQKEQMKQTNSNQMQPTRQTSNDKALTSKSINSLPEKDAKITVYEKQQQPPSSSYLGNIAKSYGRENKPVKSFLDEFLEDNKQYIKKEDKSENIKKSQQETPVRKGEVSDSDLDYTFSDAGSSCKKRVNHELSPTYSYNKSTGSKHEELKQESLLESKYLQSSQGYHTDDAENDAASFYEEQKQLTPQYHQPSPKFASTSSQNKGELIIVGEDTSQNKTSLADFFKTKKPSFAKKVEERRKDNEDGEEKEEKKGRSKEEILRIRKEMMKSKVPKKGQGNERSKSMVIAMDKNSSCKEPPSELLSRLATGKRVEVSKSDMLKLTNKNYEQLPEVKKKREEEKKREDLKNRLKQVKDLEKKRRELLMKKRREL